MELVSNLVKIIKNYLYAVKQSCSTIFGNYSYDPFGWDAWPDRGSSGFVRGVVGIS